MKRTCPESQPQLFHQTSHMPEALDDERLTGIDTAVTSANNTANNSIYHY